MNSASVAATEKQEVCREWVEMLVLANIPLSKTNHQKVQKFSQRRVKNGVAVPGAFQLQQHYLPIVYDCHLQYLRDYLVRKNIAVITDEMTDDAGCYVLTVLISTVERKWESDHKTC